MRAALPARDVVHMLECQADVVEALKKARPIRGGDLAARRLPRAGPALALLAGASLSLTGGANAEVSEDVRQACTPGYYNGEGRAGADDGLFAGLYGPGPVAFFELVKAWRDGGMEGLAIA